MDDGIDMQGGKSMKVLMQSRKNFFSLPGGDTVQLTKTKKELEKLGVQVDISLEFKEDLTGYDIIHLSNVTRIQETYLHMKNAKEQGKPVVLSTIFWPMDDFEKNGQVGLRKIIGKYLDINKEEAIKAVARYVKDKESRNEATKNLWKIGYSKMQQYVIDNADYYLPNSYMEMEQVCKYFNISSENYRVVPNAIDSNIVKEQINVNNEEFELYRDAVVCVGRIETRKNQLGLMKALKDSPYKVVLVGRPSDNQKNYVSEVMSYINNNDNFYHIPQIDNDKIYQLYKVCKVSALPSWLDTPGLTSLEAAAMGCNLAISTRGSTTEYFKEYAHYCEPDDTKSIRKAVDSAYKMEKNNKLQELVLKEYTWENAAKQTLLAYEEVLSRGTEK